MIDTPEGIRQQMSETKAQLSEKLVSLKSQVAETVQSTGTAVNATVGAVQETVESATNAVQDAVRSVTNVLDIQVQMKKHPWLVLGGAFALAYLAADLLEESSPRAGKLTRRSDEQEPQPQNAANGNGHPFSESVRVEATPPLATKVRRLEFNVAAIEYGCDSRLGRNCRRRCLTSRAAGNWTISAEAVRLREPRKAVPPQRCRNTCREMVNMSHQSVSTTSASWTADLHGRTDEHDCQSTVVLTVPFQFTLF